MPRHFHRAKVHHLGRNRPSTARISRCYETTTASLRGWRIPCGFFRTRVIRSPDRPLSRRRRPRISRLSIIRAIRRRSTRYNYKSSREKFISDCTCIRRPRIDIRVLFPRLTDDAANRGALSSARIATHRLLAERD